MIREPAGAVDVGLGSPADVDSSHRYDLRRMFLLAAGLFSAFAVYGSVVPLDFQARPLTEAVETFRALAWLHPDMSRRSDWAANILLFVPIGFCWSGGLLRRGRSFAARLAGSALILAGAVLLSLLCEFLQLWFPPRLTSVSDVAAQFIGAALGIAGWWGFGRILTAWLETAVLGQSPPSRIDFALQAYVLGLVIYSLLPFDFTISPAELYHKYREGKVELLPQVQDFAGLERVRTRVLDALSFVPVGLLVGRLRIGSASARLGLGGLFVAAVEFAQLLVYSRFTQGTDLVVGTLGVILGFLLVLLASRRMGVGALWHGHVRRQQVVIAVGICVYAAFASLELCWPLKWREDPPDVGQAFLQLWRVPFASAYFGNEFHALSQVARKVAMFVVPGALAYELAARSPKRFGLLLGSGVVLCTALGLTIEMVQAGLTSHVPDITDVCLYDLGFSLGLLLMSGLHPMRRVSQQAGE